MAIDYDNLNQAYQALRTFRQAFLDGFLTAQELKIQTAKVEANIRTILEIPVTPPA